ncbi:hypothetical protein ACFPRL_34880 [Pseudoclavibacter helvolus]
MDRRYYLGNPHQEWWGFLVSPPSPIETPGWRMRPHSYPESR